MYAFLSYLMKRMPLCVHISLRSLYMGDIQGNDLRNIHLTINQPSQTHHYVIINVIIFHIASRITGSQLSKILHV